ARCRCESRRSHTAAHRAADTSWRLCAPRESGRTGPWLPSAQSSLVRFPAGSPSSRTRCAAGYTCPSTLAYGSQYCTVSKEGPEGIGTEGLSDMTVREAVLDNGLKVLVQEVHTAPLASVWCWYRVGSKDEGPGTTGVSHWVEHMNFKGTR